MYMMKFLIKYYVRKKVIKFERLKFYVQIRLVFADSVTNMLLYFAKLSLCTVLTIFDLTKGCIILLSNIVIKILSIHYS